MIVKQRDARLATIKELEIRSSTTSDNVKRAACVSAAARLRADTTTGQATDLIDRQFGQSDEWAVIHDLRLRVHGHAVQINHVLINTSLCFICLDSRFMAYGLEIGTGGQCRALNHHESHTVASPINKMARDVRMMRTWLSDSGALPRRFGLTQKATLKGYVLTNPALRLNCSVVLAHSDLGVYPSDALFALLWKRKLNSGTRLLPTNLTPEELIKLADHLVDAHLPVFSQTLLQQDSLATRETQALLATLR